MSGKPLPTEFHPMLIGVDCEHFDEEGSPDTTKRAPVSMTMRWLDGRYVLVLGYYGCGCEDVVFELADQAKAREFLG